MSSAPLAEPTSPSLTGTSLPVPLSWRCTLSLSMVVMVHWHSRPHIRIRLALAVNFFYHIPNKKNISMDKSCSVKLAGHYMERKHYSESKLVGT
jgi:hypothetical protein